MFPFAWQSIAYVGTFGFILFLTSLHCPFSVVKNQEQKCRNENAYEQESSCNEKTGRDPELAKLGFRNAI